MSEIDPYTPDLPPQLPVSEPKSVAIQIPQVKPWVTYILLGLTAGVFLLQLGSQYLYGMDVPQILGVKYGPFIRQGQVWRLITPALLHASLWHLFANMYALFVLGPGLERHYGHARYLTLYLLSAFTGNVLSFILVPGPSLGASTAVFGLLGAQAVFLFRNKELLGEGGRRGLRSVISVAAINLLVGAMTPTIDLWGHVGGLVGGALFAWLAGPLYRIEGYYPHLNLVDEHSGGKAYLAALGIGVVFALLVLFGAAL